MYSNMKYYENICNCLGVIQQDKNRKLKSANCWQQTSLNDLNSFENIAQTLSVTLEVSLSILLNMIIHDNAFLCSCSAVGRLSTCFSDNPRTRLKKLLTGTLSLKTQTKYIKSFNITSSVVLTEKSTWFWSYFFFFFFFF